MKQFSWRSTLLLVVCLFSFTAHASTTKIQIKLTGFDSLLHLKFAEFKRSYPGIEVISQVEVSPDGKASFELHNTGNTAISFRYSDREIELLIAPDDQVYAVFPIEVFTGFSTPDKFTINGKFWQTNRLILQNKENLELLFDRINAAPAEQPLSAYRLLGDTILLEARRLIDSLLSQTTDTLFQKWGDAYLCFRVADELLVRPFWWMRDTTLSLHDAYFDFIRTVPFNAREWSELKARNMFMAKMLATPQMVVVNSQLYKTGKSRILKDSLSYLEFEIDMFSRLEDGIGKSTLIAMAWQKSNQKTRLIPALAQAAAPHLTPEIQDVLSHKNERPVVPIVELIKAYPISAKEKQELLQLYEGSAGKVVVHDFWFTNCAPCMNELPHYNDLINAAGSDVVFLFLGVHMDTEEWRSTIEKFKMNGRHILLTPNQKAFYNKYFYLSGFPHHQMVNSKGQIMYDLRIPGAHPRTQARILSIIAGLKG